MWPMVRFALVIFLIGAGAGYFDERSATGSTIPRWLLAVGVGATLAAMGLSALTMTAILFKLFERGAGKWNAIAAKLLALGKGLLSVVAIVLAALAVAVLGGAPFGDQGSAAKRDYLEAERQSRPLPDQPSESARRP